MNPEFFPDPMARTEAAIILPPQTRKRRWQLALKIRRADLDEADCLAESYKQGQNESHLVDLWKVMEPYTELVANRLCQRYQYRLGTLIEPGDLVSIAKIVFLSRLLPRWNSGNGRIMRYALVTFSIEFWKYLKSFTRIGWAEIPLEKAERTPGFKPPAEPVSIEQMRFILEMALKRYEDNGFCLAQTAQWYFEGHGTLRDAEKALNSHKGFSKSSLHRRIKATRELLRENI